MENTADQADETLTFVPKWNADGLMPVAAVDADTNDLLMLAYANLNALRKTLDTGEAHYWSRSRAALWHKGATSGAIQKVHAVEIDCDQDTLIYRVTSVGPACHTGRASCFYRRLDQRDDGQITLRALAK